MLVLDWGMNEYKKRFPGNNQSFYGELMDRIAPKHPQSHPTHLRRLCKRTDRMYPSYRGNS